MIIEKKKDMKRAMRAIALTQVNDYLGEFHTLVVNLKEKKFSTKILLGKFETINI